MKITLVLFFTLSGFLTFGQSIVQEVDSVANRRWYVMPWKVPSGADCYRKTEWVLTIKSRILVLACEDSVFLTYSANFSPKDCSDKYHDELKEPNNHQKALEHYLSCEEIYYKKPENAGKTDTLWMARNSQALEQLDKNIHSDWYITSETIYDSIGSFMFGVFYYTIEELKYSCITNNPMKKRIESWENGQKHGTWIYYDLTGEIVCEEKYSNGVLIVSDCE
jgi:hypothetical protein